MTRQELIRYELASWWVYRWPFVYLTQFDWFIEWAYRRIARTVDRKRHRYAAMLHEIDQQGMEFVGNIGDAK